MLGKSQSSARPKLACEISSDRVLAARLSDSSVVDCAVHDLPPGIVTADLTEPNVHDHNAAYRAVHDALDSISGRGTDVIAVLPDSAVRVVLLDFESLPDKRDEAESVVRFRLRKSLPFDVDKAKVSYHAQSTKGAMRVVAAVALNTVVEDYESAFREASFAPGLVMPSMLAALGGPSCARGLRNPSWRAPLGRGAGDGTNLGGNGRAGPITSATRYESRFPLHRQREPRWEATAAGEDVEERPWRDHRRRTTRR